MNCDPRRAGLAREEKPSLSVIVANFDNGRYLGQCLESVLHQTFKDLEIVVYDDGSTDGSTALLADFAYRYPGVLQVIRDPVNCGVAHARHQAMLAARGEFVTTLDSDDYFGDILKLEMEMELIADHQRHSVGDIIAYSNVLRVSEDGAPLQLMGHAGNIREGRILREIITRACMVPRDFVMRRSAYFAAGGYDLGLRTHEDWDLKIRLAARLPFFCTKRTGTSYRQRPGGLASLPHATRTENMWKVFFKNVYLVSPGEKEAVTAEFTAFMARRQQGVDRS